MDVGTSTAGDLTMSSPLTRSLKRSTASIRLNRWTLNYTGEVANAGPTRTAAENSASFHLWANRSAKNARIRLSVDGKLYKCLFATEGFDIRQMLRGGASDEEIEDAIGRIWTTRDEHYSEIRTEETVKARAGKRIEMSYIGG